MSYQAVVLMAASQSLQGRLIAACAAEGVEVDSPQQWVQQNLWRILSQDETWADAWQFAEDNKTINQNPDTGLRTDVISDEMIATVINSFAEERGVKKGQKKAAEQAENFAAAATDERSGGTIQIR